MQAFSAPELRLMANAVRALSIDAVEAAKSGHPGMPMGAADVAAALFAGPLRYDPQAPHWPDRDRFVLSAGHGSMLLYAVLHLLGSPDLPIEEIQAFRQLHSKTPGHPEYGHTLGVETTTGPLGQGLANAVGMAMAEAHLAARFGEDLVDHRTWVLAGDGCLMEGISQEAIALAGTLRLAKLTVIWDDNGISIDGKVGLADATDQKARFAACGWAVTECDGHDFSAIEAALQQAVASDRPTLIAAKTTIGFGAPTRAGTVKAHGEPLGPEEAAGAKQALDWPHAPFEVPPEVRALWGKAAAQGARARESWEERLAAAGARGQALLEALETPMPGAALAALEALARSQAEAKPAIATRAASGAAIEALYAAAPSVFGGSADLSGSNVTRPKAAEAFTGENPAGRYVHFGVREHAMAAAMNGLALHGGIVPYGGTFLSFADYMRPSLRLAALMGVRVVHVMTHDSIGLGEDGPTHQPVEHLASLRAMPNLYVFRPADAAETAAAWAAALRLERSPSVLALSRQGLASVAGPDVVAQVARGAYELAPAEGGPAQVSLFATGSEVEIALAARDILQARGVPTRVVSAPCFELFQLQPLDYRQAVLGEAPVRVGIEAAVRQGWDVFLRPEDPFVGLCGYGASGPAKALYQHFGVTAEAVAEAARRALSR